MHPSIPLTHYVSYCSASLMLQTGRKKSFEMLNL